MLRVNRLIFLNKRKTGKKIVKDSGLGHANITSPVYWGVYITNFVFWVGIGHAGTLISAILFLFRAKWRNTVNRSAEAMTVFAVITAGLFLLIHVGRVWFAAYWMAPLPNTNNMWVNMRSPLMWDVFAISTYLTISLLFWYMGLVPDLASVRDRVKGIKRLVYGLMSFGWRGDAQQWWHYEAGYGFLAALATPLVLSVHSIVSWDFAMSIQPGWQKIASMASIKYSLLKIGSIYSRLLGDRNRHDLRSVV